MTFYSQTGSTFVGLRNAQSTSASENQKNIPADTVFHILQPARFVSADGKIHDADPPRRELSPEEEEKFYKKVFKTNLI